MTFISSPIVLVLVGVIGLLVGLLIGFLFIDRDSRKSKSAGVPEEFAKDGFFEIARMLYSPTKKRIISVLDGEFFREAKDLNPDQHSRLARVLRIWNDWNNTSAAKEPTPETVGVEGLEPPKPEAVEPLPAGAAVSESTLEAAERASVPETAAEVESVFSTDFAQAVEPASEKAFIEERVVEQAPVEEPAFEAEQEAIPPVEVKNQTIVEQINAALQAMLPGTAYESRGLTLQDDQQNGVLVYAGSERFNGIDAVPYADAQELIRNAVTEWERKYESEQIKPG